MLGKQGVITYRQFWFFSPLQAELLISIIILAWASNSWPSRLLYGTARCIHYYHMFSRLSLRQSLFFDLLVLYLSPSVKTAEKNNECWCWGKVNRFPFSLLFPILKSSSWLRSDYLSLSHSLSYLCFTVCLFRPADRTVPRPAVCSLARSLRPFLCCISFRLSLPPLFSSMSSW